MGVSVQGGLCQGDSPYLLKKLLDSLNWMNFSGMCVEHNEVLVTVNYW